MEKAIEYLRGSHDFAGFTDRPDEKSTTRRIYDIIVRQDGVVSKVVETGHIYEITSESGVIILIHMGLETVALNGKCFHIYAKIGDKVKAGDLIAEADLEFIKETGRNSITPVLISSDLDGKELVCEKGEVQAGKSVIMTLK